MNIMLALENTETVYMILGATICVLLLIIILSMGRQNRLLRNNLEAITNQTTSLLMSIETLTEQTEEFGREYKKLQNDFVVKELYSAGTGSYQQAINAAKSGAEAPEIVENYGMTKNEAELLVSIHGSRTAAV